MAQPSLAVLSSRDLAVLHDLQRVRLLTARQVERLHFSKLATANARGSARRRTLGRLVRLQLVTTLPRRIGGERAGSAGLVYRLDSHGRRLLESSDSRRIRRPWSIGWPFVQHTLDVAELYVRLSEHDARGSIKLLTFEAEPASWHASGHRTLKPDAWLIYETPRWERHYWVEVDRGTESLPTLARKLRTYVDFAASGQPGPLGVVPRVLVTVPDEPRQTAAEAVIAGLPPPAAALVTVRRFNIVFNTTARPPP